MRLYKLLTVLIFLFCAIAPLKASDRFHFEEDSLQIRVKNINDILPQEILMSVFQDLKISKNLVCGKNVCKHWEHLRGDPSLSIMISLKNTSQLAQFFQSPCKQSYVKIDFHYVGIIENDIKKFAEKNTHLKVLIWKFGKFVQE